MNVLQEALVETGKTVFSRPEVLQVARKVGVNPNSFLNDTNNRVTRGVYKIGGGAPRRIQAEIALAPACPHTGDADPA